MDAASFTLTMLFKAPQFVQALATMIGLIESADKKIERLVSSELDMAVRHLTELEVVTTLETRDFLLKESWRRFEAAIVLEVGERKAHAYVGLAFSQYHLGEHALALTTLTELTEYKYIDKSQEMTNTAVSLFALPAIALSGVADFWLRNSPAAEIIQKMKMAQDRLINISLDQRVELLKTKAREFIDAEGGASATNT